MDVIFFKPLFLIPTTAFAYAFATVGLKMASSTASPAALSLIVGGFGLATLAEITLMRQMNLGIIYLAVVAVETLAVLGFAALIGEGLNGKQFIGAAFVVSGLVLVAD
jgi:drug/metabolite transporter (DMT)-like permease